METTSKRISKYIHSHGLEEDDISDIAIEIVDNMVTEGLIPDCIDTENQKEFEAQDIIRERLTELFNIKN
jgi:hypothetical protein